MYDVSPSAPPEIAPQSGLYPNIPSEATTNAENFRLSEISRIEKEIGHEAEHRRIVLKKYKKARKVIHLATVCLGSLTTIVSAGATVTFESCRSVWKERISVFARNRKEGRR